MALNNLASSNYAAARISLKHFARMVWPILEPGHELLWNWHLDLICEYLEAVTAGEEHRLLINIPPRHMKSLLVTVIWPCWEWIDHPEKRYLFVSYAASLSTEHSMARRAILRSEWYQRGMREHWGRPDFAVSKDQDEKTQYTNTSRGRMIATSMGGTGTGKGGDRVVIDDPVNPKQAASTALRNTANYMWDSTYTSRLDDKNSGAYVVIMQRLHEDDLTGHLLEQGGWTHVSAPGVAIDDEDVIFPSGRVVHRRGGGIHRDSNGNVQIVGDLLWPEREGPEVIARMFTDLGSYGFAGQYQQRPAPDEGGLLKRAYWRFYRTSDPAHEHYLPRILGCDPLSVRFDETIASWDCAVKDTNDYVAGGIISRTGSNRFVREVVCERLDFPATLKAMQRLGSRYPEVGATVVEDKANGPAVIATLKSSITGLVPFTPQGDKLSRAAAIAPELEAGNWWLPDPDEPGFGGERAWVRAFIDELATFPNAAHDDRVDMWSQAGLRLKAGRSVWDFYRGGA